MNREDLSRPRVFAWAPPAALFLLSQAGYLATLHRGVPPQDSAELITAVLTKGVPHPPGYPLLTILGIGFSRLPFGSPEFRVNYLSAFCASLAAALVYFACLELCADMAAATTAAAMFGAGVIVWRYAVIAEAFALNAVVAAALVLLALVYRRNKDARLLWAMALGFGLGVSNLHTIVLIGPTLALLCVDRRLFERRIPFWAGLAGAFLAGLLPYAYLPWAASRHPALNTGDPSTWGRFLDVFLRRAYGTLSLAKAAAQGGARWSDMAAQLSFLGRTLMIDSKFIGLPIAIVGAWRLWRRDVRLSAGLLLYLALNLPFFLWLADAPPTPYFASVLQNQYGGVLIVLALYEAAGLAFLFDFLRGFKYGRAAGCAAALLLPAAMAAANMRACDRSRDAFAERMGRLVLESVEPGAVIFSCYDTMTFVLHELRDARGLRPDAVLASYQVNPIEADSVRGALPELALPPGRGESFSKELIARANGRRPVYFTFAGLCDGGDVLREVRAHLAPEGLVYRWVESPLNRGELDRITSDGMRLLASQPDLARERVEAHADAGVREIIGWYADAYGNLSIALQALGRGDEARAYRETNERMRR